VLTALAGALRLFQTEAAHLYHLAGEVPAPPSCPSGEVPASILHLLDRLDDTPAFVMDVKYDVLAWNAMAVALLGNPVELMGEHRNMAWQLFCGPHRMGADAPPDVRRFADECVAELRAASVRYPGDEGIRRLLAQLMDSAEFVARWEEHQVCVKRSQTKVVRHPVVGELTLDCQVLEIPECGQRVVFYSAAPGTRSAEGLKLLSVVGSTPWPVHS
jgi:hypothetical protein